MKEYVARDGVWGKSIVGRGVADDAPSEHERSSRFHPAAHGSDCVTFHGDRAFRLAPELQLTPVDRLCIRFAACRIIQIFPGVIHHGCARIS